MFDPNEILVRHPVRIYLTGEWMTVVSPEDADLMLDWWQLHQDQRGRLYARRQVRIWGVRSSVYLHRAIMLRVSPPPSPKHVVDHIDGFGLNNTRPNLRWVTVGENNKNKSRKNYMSDVAFQRKLTGNSWIRNFPNI